jgi:hypothetical protein
MAAGNSSWPAKQAASSRVAAIQLLAGQLRYACLETIAWRMQITCLNMRDNVTFRSTVPVDLDKHPPGEELARYIADKLTESGMKIREIDNYEDFAWPIEFESDQTMPWAILGYVDDGAAQWLLQINSSVSWFGRLLGNSDEPGRRMFTERLHALLTNDSNFSDVRWHLGDWNHTDWTAGPF